MREIRQQFIDGMSCVAATVTVVTTDGPSGCAGVTVSAMSSVSADTEKPTLLVCVNQSSSGAAPILGNGTFCVNILRDDQTFVSDTFAGRHGDKGEAKFGCADWTAGISGSPMLDGALVNFDCRLIDSRLLGTHHVLFGQVEHVRLSEPGRSLVYANRAYGTSLSLQRQAQNLAGSASQCLRIACLSSFAPLYLPCLMARMHAMHPELKLDLHECDQAEAVQLLESGEVDAALVFDRQLPSSLSIDRLASLAPHVLLAANHPLADCDTLPLADLAGEPMVLLDAPLSRDYFTGLFTKAGLVPNIAIRTPSFEMLRGLVANGLGYSLLVTNPDSERSYDGRPLVRRPLKDWVDPICVALVRRGGAKSTLGLDAFASHCVAQIGNKQ
jgi:flavin reductase (DIM6/NTAB) family NADH-FMN oxidoreductase RutF